MSYRTNRNRKTESSLKTVVKHRKSTEACPIVILDSNSDTMYDTTVILILYPFTTYKVLQKKQTIIVTDINYTKSIEKLNHQKMRKRT